MVNTLRDSFIENQVVEDQRLLTAEEVQQLLTEGNISEVSLSGDVLNILADFGVQRDLSKIYCKISPVTTTGICISYGREEASLISGVLFTDLDSTYTEPTISGYTCPRYINFSISGAFDVLELGAISDSDDIKFKQSLQEIDTITLVAGGVAGYSDIRQIEVVNSGNLTSDIYVGVDPSSVSSGVLENIEISLSPTGNFLSTISGLNLPEDVPWEWGTFENINLSNNKLNLISSTESYPTFEVGTEVELSKPLSIYGNVAIPVTMSGNTYVVATVTSGHAPLFIDPIRNRKIIGASPAYTPATDNEKRGHGLTWDDDDRLYYMSNSTDQTLRYYQISTNTHHVLTTVPFYARRIRELCYVGGDVYIAGGLATSGTSASVGQQFWKVNVDTLASTQLSDVPSTIYTTLPRSCRAGSYIYMHVGTYGLSGGFLRYNLNNGSWEILADLPGSPIPDVVGLSYNSEDGHVYIITGVGYVYKHNINTAITNASPVHYFSGTYSPNHGNLCVNNSLIYAATDFSISTSYAKVYVLDDVPAMSIPEGIVGTWTSPVFKIGDEEQFSSILLDYIKDQASELKADDTLGVDNFEVRGSDVSPAAYNLIENFNEALSTDVYYTDTLNSYSTIVSSGGTLSFSHSYISADTPPYNGAYVYFSLPLSTAGKMQYRFWWNPSSDKTSGISSLSKFMLVPFSDLVAGERLPTRGSSTFERTDGNYIYIEFGQSSDSAGIFTALKVYKGTSTDTYLINATTGTFYLVELIIDWSNGSYSLYFNSTLLGTSFIPMAQVAKLGSEHTYEIFSTGREVSFEERFKYLSINRLTNTIPESITNAATPAHREDEIFGDSGSAAWVPVTVNNCLLPKYRFLQFRLTLKSTGTWQYPTVISSKFPVVYRLENVASGDSRSLYLRYNFPATNNLATNIARLKSWMFVDKE